VMTSKLYRSWEIVPGHDFARGSKMVSKPTAYKSNKDFAVIGETEH
jgi:hypothetical protein